ncbi:MAG: urease accessory UreF family protein [Limnobacter sp.]|nr:urease accessory UreF family protein [Limnobacter sp.]
MNAPDLQRNTLSDLSMLRLMHLCSVSLPVGGYSFSHGLEYAIDAAWVKTPLQVQQWIQLQIFQGLARVDLPILRLAMSQPDRLQELNDLALACRESKELRMTDLAMGEALHRLLPTLGVAPFLALPSANPIPQAIHSSSTYKQQAAYSFVVLFAQACLQWNVPVREACLGYLWSWVENQVAAASKLVPLGQTTAQAMIAALQPDIPEAVYQSTLIEEDEIGACLPGLAMASALHETQYSRLFRS